MPIDSQCRKFVEMMAAMGAPPMEQQTHLELRAGRVAAAAEIAEMAGPEEPMAQIEDRTIPGAASELPIRIYWPTLASNAPVLLYFHGGGWVIGDIPSWDRTCRSLAAASGCIVVSAEYRLAPEHKFPAAAEDAYAALQWMIHHAGEIGGDPARVAVGGDSAGGNLATVACILARDRGGLQAAFQLLIYPVTDFEHESPSMVEFAKDHFLTPPAMRKFWDFYLNSTADGDSPLASPFRADLAGLPPAFIITAECDPLRDQGEAYGAKLNAAGVKTQVKRYDGAIHAFFSMAGVIDSGKQAIADAGAALHAALA